MSFADWDSKVQAETAPYAPPTESKPEYPTWTEAPAPAPSFTTIPATIQITENAPVDPMENEDMFRAFMTKVANKVVEASGLAAKVAELEGKVAALQSEAGMWEQKHREEAANHEVTRRDLDAVRKSLSDEQEYSRLQREETERFRQERDTSRTDSANAQEHINRVESENRNLAGAKDHAEQEAATLREQVTRLNAKIANMVQALQS